MTMHKTKKELNRLYTELKRAYLEGELEGVPIAQIAKDNEIMWLTAKGWIAKIEEESKAQQKRKPDRSVVTGVPLDWQWLKITVSQETKDKFDSLSREQQVDLFKIFTVDLINLDLDDSESPIIIEKDKGLVNKCIALKVSPEAIKKWNELPAIKGNKFSRSAWAINKVIVPFVNRMIK